jgi:hypothetical protein
MNYSTVDLVDLESQAAEREARHQADRDWNIANYNYLSTAIELLRNRLECYVAPVEQQLELQAQAVERQQAFEMAATALTSPSALDRLCQLFNLSLG